LCDFNVRAVEDGDSVKGERNAAGGPKAGNAP